MKKIIIALIFTLLLSVLITGCGRMAYNDSTTPVGTPYPTDTLIDDPYAQDGIVNDSDGVIGNERRTDTASDSTNDTGSYISKGTDANTNTGAAAFGSGKGTMTMK